MVDLHTHSNASDGDLSPSDLVTLAWNSGVTAMALTDHDTVAGIVEAGVAARTFGMKLIPGVEIEVEFEPGEFHLLGLNVSNHESLQLFLKRIRERRAERNRQMIEVIREDGKPITMDHLNNLAGGEVIGRMHFARWLIDHGAARHVPDCFERWLGPGRPYHVSRLRPSLEESVDAIHQAGGLAVIAHPLSLWVSWGKLSRLLAGWKENGVDGIEARHSGASSREAFRFEELARANGMFITGGSDFHGTGRPDRKLGYGADKQPLNEVLIESLRV